MRKLQPTVYAAVAAALSFAVALPASALCGGDCDNDGKVTITEVVTVINMALGATATCANADADGSGAVEVNDAVAAVNNAARAGGLCPAMGECGNGIVEAPEECDIGGICAGGSTSGTACTSEAACGLTENGVCDGGTGALRQCTDDDDCGGGKCDRCRTYGAQPIPGDPQNRTCSATCSYETTVAYKLEVGVFDISVSPPILTTGSGAIVHSGLLGDVPLSLGSADPNNGIVTFTVGKPANGVAPVALRATDLKLTPIDVAGLACACVRGVPAQTCGGFVLDLEGGLAQDCTTGFPSAGSCPTNLPCTFVHGPGNSGQGLLGCSGLSPINLNVSQDSLGSGDPMECLEPGIGAPTCADPPVIALSGSSTLQGSQITVTHTAIGVRTGGCGGFCTDTDPVSQRGSVTPLILTTGTATGLVSRADGLDDFNQGPHSLTGNPVSCENLNAGNASGAALAGTFTAINQDLLGDIVVEILFAVQ